MKEVSTNTFKHVCPRNCFSNCTMMTTVNNNTIASLHGDKNNLYTNGKLCAKGYAYIERNYHEQRLKFPYYQEVKGSGKFRRITWKKAFELIVSKMLNIHHKYEHFLPLASYRGTGNIGVHHFVTDDFLASLGPTTKISSTSVSTTGFEAIQYDTGAVKMSNPMMIREADMIIIWGANPATTNIHLIPYILAAKTKGAKLVVIDPIYSQTAELADLYIQIRPSTDGALANLLTKDLLQTGIVDEEFLNEYSYGFNEFSEELHKINKNNVLDQCGIINEAYEVLIEWLKNSSPIAHIIGTGILKHKNGGQTVRAIEALAAIHGDIGKRGGGIFFRRNDTKLFQNQKSLDKNRMVNLNQLKDAYMDPPIEMLWISNANPLVQEPNTSHFSKLLNDIPFVVAVDLSMTPTAYMSNLILPTTTHFEELDIVANYWHREIELNERAVPPFYESISEWEIMNTLALLLNEANPNLCHFPIHENEEEYLNNQFSDEVYDRIFVKNMNELRRKNLKLNVEPVWKNHKFATESGKYEFYSFKAKEKGLTPTPIYDKGLGPSEDYPYWLLSPHAPHTFNSQFHFLDFSGENEAFIRIHPSTANNLNIVDGEIVTVHNEQGEIEVKAIFSNKVPKDILLIYHRWYEESDVIINQLVPNLPTDMGENGAAFFDTFVNVRKL